MLAFAFQMFFFFRAVFFIMISSFGETLTTVSNKTAVSQTQKLQHNFNTGYTEHSHFSIPVENNTKHSFFCYL